MLSIQQVLKALRKLQNSATSADIVLCLQHAAASSGAPPLPLPPPSPGIVTSCPTESEMSTSASASVNGMTSSGVTISPEQQPNQQLEQQTNDSSPKRTQRDSTTLSFILHVNESGPTTEAAKSITATTPPSPPPNDFNTATKSVSGNNSYLRRSTQQIQNFYQQQQHLQHFHTEQRQSLNSKQKQTQFAMSSLAAEPLALKQDDLVATTNGGDCRLPNDAVDDPTAQQKTSAAGPSGKPCFNTGLAEILQFMELIGNLKHTKRTGWVLRDVNDCESISGHMYRMSMMTFLLDGSEGLNQIRCMELALVHDLAESLVGDITPFCGVSKEEKRAMEFKAMEDICKLIEPRGKRIMELFEEYEHGESAESKFVKDLDRLDMVMQAFEYEKRDNCLLKHQEFFDSTEGKFQHPFVKKLVNEIYEQRKNLARDSGATPPPIADSSSVASAANGHCSIAPAELLDQQQQQQSSSTTSS